MVVKQKMSAFTLIEMTIFIVVLGIVAFGIMMAFNAALEKGPSIEYSIQAAELAQERMSFILGQRYINGFSSFTDLCTGGSPPSICTPPTGFTVSSSITSVSSTIKQITVTVSGLGASTLISQVGGYL